MSATDNSSIRVAIVVTRVRELSARWYVRQLTEVTDHQIEVIYSDDHSDSVSIAAAIRELARYENLNHLLVKWPASHEMAQAILDVGSELHIPTVLLRERLVRCRRIVIATGGGANAIDLMWLAHRLSSTQNLPVKVLRLRSTRGDNAAHDDDDQTGHKLEQMLTQIVRLSAEIETIYTDDPVTALADKLVDGDSLLMGAPSPLRVATSFHDSLPALMTERVNNTLIMMNRGSARQPDLHRLLWGGLAAPALKAANKREAIELLVDNLVSHNQIPESHREMFVEQAMQRERMMPSAVGSQAAFPHVRLHDFAGVAASFGVFPEGVDFGSPDKSKTNFVCFMVSPHGFYEDYLAVLAMLARQVVVPEVRKALMQATTSGEIVAALASGGEI